MNNLYNKICESIKTGLQNALVIDPIDSSINYQKSGVSNNVDLQGFVDMGTDVLWAEYNLGAFPGDKPEDWYGDYYAWGETETKDYFDIENYYYFDKNTYKITKYIKIDNKFVIEPNDDVISVTMGNRFRMPTKEDFEDLLKHATYEWIKDYKGIKGLNGLLLIAENKNTLFFPAADIIFYDKNSSIGDYKRTVDTGGVWTSTHDLEHLINAYSFWFANDRMFLKLNMAETRRFAGLPVRAVCDKK